MKRKKGLSGIESRVKRSARKTSVRPSRIFIYALALAALGGGGYLLYDHFRKKKNQNAEIDSDSPTAGENDIDIPGSTTTASAKTRTRVKASDGFPLRKGSKGARVTELQQALIKKGAAIKADGKFGAATLAALKALGYSETIDTTTFASLTGKEPALQIVFNPGELARKLYSAARRRNDKDAVYLLQQIKNVNEYSAVNEYYKKFDIISKTIVTDFLDYAFKPDAPALERIKVEFTRIGLKVNGAGVWSLQGIQLYKDLITLRPTVVVDSWNNRLPVLENTILGDEVKVENGMTWFRSVDRTILKVPTRDVKYTHG